MAHLLNLIGLGCSIIVLLAALRVLFMAQRAEVSARSILAFLAFSAGAWPFAIVLSGKGDLGYGHASLLFVVAAYIVHRYRQTRGVDPRRATDWAELL